MQALRKRKAADGLREVRGIWADPKDHAAIKRQAKEHVGGSLATPQPAQALKLEDTKETTR
jgi:hypothetical protein